MSSGSGGSGVFSDLESMTITERKNSQVLVVEPDQQVRVALRKTLIDLGYKTVGEASDHIAGVQRFQERPFTHVIFSASETNMPPKDFLLNILEMDDSVIGIPSSLEPTVDDVFGLLIEGAQGFLVKPFTGTSLEEAISAATKGEPISDAILYARDRNEALASLAMTALDKLSILTRQAQEFETAKRELPIAILVLKRAVGLGRTFAKDGDEGLLAAYMEMCIKRAEGPASALGRLRKRREQKKEAIRDRRKLLTERREREEAQLRANIEKNKSKLKKEDPTEKPSSVGSRIVERD